MRDLGFAGQLDAGDHVGQRGILDQVDDLVAAARQGAADGLGQQDGDHGPGAAEPERACGLQLALLDGAQGAAHILRMVGAAAERKPQDGGRIMGLR